MRRTLSKISQGAVPPLFFLKDNHLHEFLTIAFLDRVSEFSEIAINAHKICTDTN